MFLSREILECWLIAICFQTNTLFHQVVPETAASPAATTTAAITTCSYYYHYHPTTITILVSSHCDPMPCWIRRDRLLLTQGQTSLSPTLINIWTCRNICWDVLGKIVAIWTCFSWLSHICFDFCWELCITLRLLKTSMRLLGPSFPHQTYNVSNGWVSFSQKRRSPKTSTSLASRSKPTKNPSEILAKNAFQPDYLPAVASPKKAAYAILTHHFEAPGHV